MCVGDGSSRRPPSGHVTRRPHTGSGRSPCTADDEALAELPAREKVDDEVDGRVEDGQRVSYGRVVVVPVAAETLVVGHGRPEDVVDQGRRLAEHEDEGEYDEDEGDVRAFTRRLCRRRRCLLLAPLTSPQRLDQSRVEEGQAEEWPTVHQRKVGDVGVEDAVEAVVTERADFESRLR